MTLLPSKTNLVGLNQSQGTVRTALGDFLDAVSEAIGTSGTAPLLRNASILGATSVGIGVNMVSPGTTLQVFGSFSLTDTNTPASNPGAGSGFIRNQLLFGNQHAAKLLLNADSAQAIGTQSGVLYQRAPAGGGFGFYVGGIHNSNPYNPGGGSEVFRVSNTELLYRGQPVYTVHQHGNSLANLGSSQVWTNYQDFNARVRVRGSDFSLGAEGALTPLIFDWGVVPGRRILFTGFNDVLTLGVHTVGLTSLYLRSDAFAIYSRGVHDDTFGNPGVGGTVLFTVTDQAITHKSNRVLDVSMYGHRSDSTGINADMVDNLHGSSLVTKVSSIRSGVNILYRWDADTPEAVRLEWFQGRMWLFSWHSTAGNTYETAVDFSTNSRLLGGLAATEYVRRVSPTRNGTNILYRWESDVPQAVRLEGSEGRLRLISWEVTTGTTISTSVDYAYAAGTAQNISGSVPVNQLHKGTNNVRVPVQPINGGSDTVPPRFDVNMYSLADMVLSGNNTGRYVFVASVSNAATAPYRSYCAFVPGSTTPTGAVTVSWDYLSNSGNPEIWVAYDSLTGEIKYMAESEDPINEDLTSPLHNLGEGLNYSLVEIPSLWDIQKIQDKAFKGKKNKPKDKFKECLDKLVRRRGFAMQPTDSLTELVYDQDSSKEKQAWRQLLILRATQESLIDSSTSSCIELIQNSFKVGNKGLLELR